MCQRRSTLERFLDAKIGFKRIDACMEKELREINSRKKKYKTLASCCGHGIYEKTIVIESPKGPVEYFTGIKIPRKKRFYVKDRHGFYFIPEIVNQYNYVLGSPVPTNLPNEHKRDCFFCKKTTYYVGDWEWHNPPDNNKPLKPVCFLCAVTRGLVDEKGLNLRTPQKVEQQTKELLGLDDFEMENLIGRVHGTLTKAAKKK